MVGENHSEGSFRTRNQVYLKVLKKDLDSVLSPQVFFWVERFTVFCVFYS